MLTERYGTLILPPAANFLKKTTVAKFMTKDFPSAAITTLIRAKTPVTMIFLNILIAMMNS